MSMGSSRYSSCDSVIICLVSTPATPYHLAIY
nr:MAG TPA: hypothetical protein [Caudoviricetes sp.]